MDRLRSMRVFARVAHVGSFAAAGRELRTSAASVTKLVAYLESELGVRLLERTTRSVQLTEAGRFYLERCLETLQSIDDADAAMSEMSRAPRGVLRLTAPVDLAHDVTQVMARFGERYPRVTLDLRLANHNIDLIDQGFDLGIGLLAPSHGSYVARRLCTTRIGVFAAPAYLAAHGRPRKPADLARHRHLIFVEPMPRTEWTFRKRNRTTKIEISGTMMSNSGRALLQLCVAGMGLFITPSFGVYQALDAGQVVPVLTDYEMVSFGIHVRYPSRRFLPAKVRCFLECLKDHFGADPKLDPWWPALGPST